MDFGFGSNPYGGGGGGRRSSEDPQGYQMLAQGSDDEIDPYADRAPRGGGGGGGRGGGYREDDYRSDDRRGGGGGGGGGGRYRDDFDDDYGGGSKGGRRGSKSHYDDYDDRRGGRGHGGYDDGQENCYAGYRGYVRERNAHEMSHNHVVKDEYGVDRTQANKIKIFVSPRSIRFTDYDNEIIDDITYTEITKIDHKHDRGQSDGHRNFLGLNLKDGSVFVINSPQTPDIKADIMDCVQRSRSVNVGTYKRNY